LFAQGLALSFLSFNSADNTVVLILVTDPTGELSLLCPKGDDSLALVQRHRKMMIWRKGKTHT
jgi:hypothetical protein